LVFIAKRWAKGFGIVDKDVEGKKEKNVYVCGHTQEREKKKRWI
jgi:hypothetical protein